MGFASNSSLCFVQFGIPWLPWAYPEFPPPQTPKAGEKRETSPSTTGTHGACGFASGKPDGSRWHRWDLPTRVAGKCLGTWRFFPQLGKLRKPSLGANLIFFELLFFDCLVSFFLGGDIPFLDVFPAQC